MSYFDMFPNIYYSAKGDGKFTIMKDLLARVKLIANVKDNILGFDYYDVKDGETPEMIAHKYYGDVNLHWTILVVNDVIDYYEAWPMSVQRFEQFVKDKYDNPQGIHHYEISQTSGDTTVKIDVGMNVTDYPSADAISFYQYEQALQDEKRKIRLIQPRFISNFVDEFEAKIKEGA